MKQLKTILQSKGIKDSGQSMDKSDYGLLHFHIEAAENDIKMNKFETSAAAIANKDKKSKPSLRKSQMAAHANLGEIKRSSSMRRGPQIILQETLDDQSIDFKDNLHEDLQTTNLSIPSHINNDAHLHDMHVENFEQIEAEDMVDKKLFADSPTIEKKRKPVERFMMNLKVAQQSDDAVSQASFATQNEFAKHLNSPRTFSNKPQRTILFTRENNDLEPDYLNMDLKYFRKLDADNMARAYTRLLKVTVPVFSGSVNTLINKLDPNKVAQEGEKDVAFKKKIKIEKKRKGDLNAVENDLLEELKICKEALE